MKQDYWRDAYFCKKCKVEIGSSICPHCGGRTMTEEVDIFAVIKMRFVKEPILWWNPLTWNGGHWESVEAKGRGWSYDFITKKGLLCDF